MAEYFKNVFNGVYTVLIGMRETWKHLFRPAITITYPHARFALPPGTRMQLFMNADDCIGCYKCARICPVDCIYIDTVKAKPNEDLGKASTGNETGDRSRQAGGPASKSLSVRPAVPTDCCFRQSCFSLAGSLPAVPSGVFIRLAETRLP